MVLKEIDSSQFRDMVRVATHRMGKNAEFVNSLNVFPVPDGDTGTNMNLTIESGAKSVSENPSTNVGDLTESLAKGMLIGNSGKALVFLDTTWTPYFCRMPF